MGQQNFGVDDVCVVVLPSGPEGDRILEVVRIWTGNWLLSPAIWVRSEDVPVNSDLPPEIPARIIGRSLEGGHAEAQIELFWTLGERHHPRVRLIAVQMKQDPELQELTKHAITHLDKYLLQAMPLDHEKDPLRDRDEGDTFTEFVRINLIVDAAEMDGVRASSVFRYDWNANVVASPEDRSEPYASDAPPIEPDFADTSTQGVVPGVAGRSDRYFGWVVGHLATSAGLWSGLGESIYALMQGRSGKAHEMCIVQRVTVRGIITDGLAVELGLLALSAAESESEEQVRMIQSALQEHGLESIADVDVPERVALMVEETLQGFRNEGFGYREFISVPPFAPQEESIWRALGRYFSKGWNATLRIPAIITDLLLKRVGDRLTVKDGSTVVSGPLTWNAGIPRVDDGIFKIPVAAPPSAAGLSAAPNLWRDLNALLFAAIDGNPNLTHGSGLLTSPISGQRVVFPTRTDILPSPEQSWSLDPDAGLRLEGNAQLNWLDQARAEKSLKVITETHDARRDQLAQARGELSQARKTQDIQNEKLFDLEFEMNEVLEQVNEYEAWLHELHSELLPSENGSEVESDV